MSKAAFLDRDGVINRKPAEGQYVTNWDEMQFLPGVARAIALLNGSGFRVIVVSNQRCIAKELITVADLDSLHRQMCDSLAGRGATIDGVYYCPHEKQPPCSCRKPAPGLLLDAARKHQIDLTASWMIGDSEIDVEAGRNAGCKTARLLDGQEAAAGSADVVAPSLLEAIHKILECEESQRDRMVPSDHDNQEAGGCISSKSAEAIDNRHSVAAPTANGPCAVTEAIPVGQAKESFGGDVALADLPRKAAHGALVSTVGQAGVLVLRTGSLMVLARLLLKEDFGLVNMVTAFTGFLALFRDAGLSMATIQHGSLTTAQVSTLFWANLLVGGLLALLAVAAAPVIAVFYQEPRLFWVTVALGTSFLFIGAAAQHRAMLQRSMRFSALALVDIVSMALSIALAIGMALSGYGYWALVVMTIAQPALSLPGVWMTTRWIPGMPQRQSGVRSMLMFGGAVTLNNLIIYIGYNVDKVLIGRWWGAAALGIYGRAYQLINLPTDNLYSTIGWVAFPVLSRLQNDPSRLRTAFLKSYSVFLSLVMPITMACALFADDIIAIFLGPKWHEAVLIFRLLTPTVLGFALINPFAWLMLAGGRAGRFLRIAMSMTPVLILSYALGLTHGPQGVALGFSIGIVVCIVPFQLWAKQGTLITARDIYRAVAPSVISVTIAAGATLAVYTQINLVEPPLVQLVAECAILFGVYLLSLLFLMKQKAVYVGLFRDTGINWPLGRRRSQTQKSESLRD